MRLPKLRAAVPVSPGPDGAAAGVPDDCSACWSQTDVRELVEIDGIAVTLCVDAAACARRYRAGVSAESYAAELRGDILTAASL